MNYYSEKVALFKSQKQERMEDRKAVSIRLHRNVNEMTSIFIGDTDWAYLKYVAKSHDIWLKSLLKIILEDFIQKHKTNEYIFERFGI